jgi:hypothetical protein
MDLTNASTRLEDPGTADLRARDLAGLGAAAEFLRMAAQEGGGFFDIESPHGGIPAGGTSTALAGDAHHAGSPAATPFKVHPGIGNSEPIRAQRSRACAIKSAQD